MYNYIYMYRITHIYICTNNTQNTKKNRRAFETIEPSIYSF